MTAALAILEAVLSEAGVSAEVAEVRAAKDVTLRDVQLRGASTQQKGAMPCNGLSPRSASHPALESLHNSLSMTA